MFRTSLFFFLSFCQVNRTPIFGAPAIAVHPIIISPFFLPSALILNFDSKNTGLPLPEVEIVQHESVCESFATNHSTLTTNKHLEL